MNFSPIVKRDRPRLRRQFWERAYLTFLNSPRLQNCGFGEGVTREDTAAYEADKAMGEWDVRFKAAERMRRKVGEGQ